MAPESVSSFTGCFLGPGGQSEQWFLNGGLEACFNASAAMTLLEADFHADRIERPGDQKDMVSSLGTCFHALQWQVLEERGPHRAHEDKVHWTSIIVSLEVYIFISGKIQEFG